MLQKADVPQIETVLFKHLSYEITTSCRSHVLHSPPKRLKKKKPPTHQNVLLCTKHSSFYKLQKLWKEDTHSSMVYNIRFAEECFTTTAPV